jgi:predicted permease
MSDRAPIRLARLAASVLRLAPSAFRDRYAETIVSDLAALLAAERSSRGTVAMLRLWGRGLDDLLRALRCEWDAEAPNRVSAFTDISGDVRSVMRAWRRTPGHAVTIALMLMLGLGLTAAVFAFADGYLFRALPFPDGDRLFFVRDPDGEIVQTLRASETIALRATAVGRLGFVEWGGRTALPYGDLVAGSRRITLQVQGVSPGFAEVVQLPLAAGRYFGREEPAAVSPVPVWVSYRAWQREFGGDPAVLGRVFAVEGPQQRVDVVVVGIMDRRVTAFDLNNAPPELVAPAVAREPGRLGPMALSFPIVRLPRDMTIEQAEAEIGAALQGVAPAPAGKVRRVRLRSVYEYQVDGGRPTARALLTGALLVLLLISINLVHLQLAQSIARASEIATRAALGASQWRIARLFLVESAVLGTAGIGGGLLLGAWLSSVIAARVPQYPSSGRNLALVPMSFDTRVILVAVGLGLLITLMTAVWPAWRAFRRPLTVSGRTGTAARVPARVSSGVLISELAVASVILLGTVFIGLGIWRYLNQPLGFSYQDRLWVSVDKVPRVSSAQDVDQTWTAVRLAMATMPGVRAVGADETSRRRAEVRINAQHQPDVSVREVTDGHLEAWQIQMRAGRYFSPEEYRDGAAVAIVNARLAQRIWPDGNAIGREVRVGDEPARRVIGISASRVYSLSQPPPEEVYIPRADQPAWDQLVVWAPGIAADVLADRLTPIVHAVLPGARVTAVPLEFQWVFNRQTGEAEFQAPLMLGFGLLTFLLAGVGVFGLVSYLVAQRTREFGIRLALGARRHDVWRGVFRESIAPAGLGLAVGVAAAWALERVLSASVFGWESSGVLAVLVVAGALLFVAVVAAIGPARRVLRIDPAVVLRSE